ncbi:uncharacterized protein TNCV_3739031 [Trichonephila clavipes]|nr:uncharacterized protein TNCV_3739031 [Trichonephila clavipes]
MENIRVIRPGPGNSRRDNRWMVIKGATLQGRYAEAMQHKTCKLQSATGLYMIQVVEESKSQKSKLNSQIELERLKLERVKAELKLAILRNSANNREISLNGCDTEMSINEDMELPQGTEEVLPLKSERDHMFSVVSDAVALPVTVGEKRDYLETHLVNC